MEARAREENGGREAKGGQGSKEKKGYGGVKDTGMKSRSRGRGDRRREIGR